MMIEFGMHQGKQLAPLLIDEPGYIAWMLDRPDAKGKLREAQDAAIKMINHFQQKPYVVPCQTYCCEQPVTRMFAQPGYRLRPWCGKCAMDPGSSQSMQLMHYLDIFQAQRVGIILDSGSDAIAEMAIAKGLSREASEQEVISFFTA